jgi:hypothetical protein
MHGHMPKKGAGTIIRAGTIVQSVPNVCLPTNVSNSLIVGIKDLFGTPNIYQANLKKKLKVYFYFKIFATSCPK